MFHLCKDKTIFVSSLRPIFHQHKLEYVHTNDLEFRSWQQYLHFDNNHLRLLLSSTLFFKEKFPHLLRDILEDLHFHHLLFELHVRQTSYNILLEYSVCCPFLRLCKFILPIFIQIIVSRIFNFLNSLIFCKTSGTKIE